MLAVTLSNDSLLVAAVVSVAAVALLVNFFPFLAAAGRRHPATAGIGVVCLFLGWTLIGWVVALAWAYNGDERRR